VSEHDYDSAVNSYHNTSLFFLHYLLPLGIEGYLIMNNYIFLGVFLAVSVVFAASGILLGRLFAPYKPNREKSSVYECGVEPIGEAWVPVRMSFYLYALIFVIFDIETVLLLPVLTVYKNMGWIALVDVGIFVGILTVGLWYVWKKGALRWE